MVHMLSFNKGRMETINFEIEAKSCWKGKSLSKAYNYSNLNPNIILNYVWFKSNGDFQKILDKVFKEKAKVAENVFFLKQNNRTVKRVSNKFKSNAVNAVSYDGRRSVKERECCWV